MINFGLVGVGRLFNSRLAEVFERELLGACVKSVCDLDISKATDAAHKLRCDVDSCFDELVVRSDIDVLYIATESGNHFSHARSALRAGKHVIVEKPPTLFPGELIELTEEAEKHGLMYSVILQNRFNPAIKVLKAAQEKGRFGKILIGTVRLRWCRYQEYYEDGWHGTWEMDGGVISQQAFHHIDALQWICGDVEEVVSAQANLVNRLEAEDTTVASIKFTSGALGVIEATTAVRPRDVEASLSIIGENGVAVIGGIALNNVEHWEFIESERDDENATQKFSQEVPTGYGLSHGPLIQEIINRLETGNIVPPFGGIDALPAINLMHALYRSAEIGGWSSVGQDSLSARLGRRDR